MTYIDLRRLSTIKLPDGRRAAQLSRLQLFAAMNELGVPVTAEMGNQDMLQRYQAHIEEQEAKAKGQPSTYNTAHETVKAIMAETERTEPPQYDVGSLPSWKQILPGKGAA